MSWTYNLKIGDRISLYRIVDYKRTGEVREFIVDSQELLDNIIKYESDDNYHGMRIIDKD